MDIYIYVVYWECVLHAMCLQVFKLPWFDCIRNIHQRVSLNLKSSLSNFKKLRKNHWIHAAIQAFIFKKKHKKFTFVNFSFTPKPPPLFSKNLTDIFPCLFWNWNIFRAFWGKKSPPLVGQKLKYQKMWIKAWVIKTFFHPKLTNINFLHFFEGFP